MFQCPWIVQRMWSNEVQPHQIREENKKGEELGFVNGGCAVQNSMQRHLSAYEEGVAETQGRTTH